MKKQVSVVCMFFLMMAILMVPALRAYAESTTQTLTFGLVTSLTGPLAVAFSHEAVGAKATEDLLNKQGGVTVKGKKYNIKIVVVDDQSSPPGAATAAKKLIQDDIKFVVQSLFTPNAQAILPIFERAKVLSTVSQCHDPSLFDGKKFRYAFNAWNDAASIPYMDKYLLDRHPKVKKIAMIAADEPSKGAAHALAAQSAQELGLQYVYNGLYAVTTMDFSPIVTKAMAANPDAINVMYATEPWAASIINGARQLGFTGPVYAPCMMGDINITNSLVNPEYAYDLISGGPDVTSPTMPDIVKKLAALVKSQANVPLNMGHVPALLALLPMIQGIEKAQSMDPTEVVTAMESIESYNLAWGKGVPAGPENGGNHNLLPPIPVSIIINNGKTVVSDLIQR